MPLYPRRNGREVDAIFHLQNTGKCDINFSQLINALNGKIACLRVQERGGHRLKVAPMRVAWFAQERSVRAERFYPPPLSGGKVYAIGLRKCGWYRGRLAFRPNSFGMRGIFLY